SVTLTASRSNSSPRRADLETNVGAAARTARTRLRSENAMEPLVIMALVLFEVALWQWRVAITMRGNVAGGVALALIAAVVQITVISRVVQDIGDLAKVVGYACGVAAGVMRGCLVHRRLSV